MVGLSPTGPFAAPTAGTSQTMLNFERASLNRKLTSMCLLAASSALLVAYLAFACGTVLDHRRTQGAQLAALAARVLPRTGVADLALAEVPADGAGLVVPLPQRRRWALRRGR